jgi:hypothetical protein
MKKIFDKTSNSPALEKFLRSMNIGYLEWHDGIGYDLNALKHIQPNELKQVEDLLISRKDSDWRDVEALAALGTPSAIEALKDCLHSPNNDVKFFAVRYLKEMNVTDRIEEVLLETLPQTKIGYGLTYALTLAEENPSEAIKQKLLWCCLNGNDDIRIHCAAMSLFLYGKAKSNFDSDQKIVFKFGNKDYCEREKAFSELCQLIGINPLSITNDENNQEIKPDDNSR